MIISKIEGILNKNKLLEIRQLIEKGEFIEGLISGGTTRTKKNLELSAQTENYVAVVNIVERVVRENVEFNLTAFPRYMTRPIISRYDVNMYYKEHVDSPIMGFMSSNQRMGWNLPPLGNNYVRSDLSMTLFLSEPDSYDGGELIFQGSLEPVKMKLNAGSAVLYPTGTRHSVSPVTRGTRFAAIFWIQSLFPEESHWQVVYNNRKLMKLLGYSCRIQKRMIWPKKISTIYVAFWLRYDFGPTCSGFVSLPPNYGSLHWLCSTKAQNIELLL